jgi:ParB-like chromosome segregation protein Spo0J
LKSLIVRKVEGGEYAVVDGGLRLRALQRLGKKGTLKKSLPMACSVLSGKTNATEISLAANMHAPVLVQPEMERGFSPLVSIARAPADRVARPERNGDRQVEAADGNCNWFQKETQVGSGRKAQTETG